MGNYWTSVDVDEVIKATDQALLCDIEGREVWIPRSQVNERGEVGPDADEGDCGELVIPRWLAEREEL